ncbi:MAG: hypothetical protein JNM60_08735 [Candidatus Competibacteraceae bacterium]|nr:hypothetical protein [Candidatus Competibacteraceae bacterium]
MKRTVIPSAVVVLSGLLLGFAPPSSRAQGYGYYPEYDPPPPGYYEDYNPSVRRDYYSEDEYAPDGTYHSEDIVEDRRASYYSPGRNRAITRPQTSVDYWSDGPGHRVRREHTRWIGADGKPHSTTVESETVTDPYGDSHTDTTYTLRKRKAP